MSKSSPGTIPASAGRARGPIAPRVLRRLRGFFRRSVPAPEPVRADLVTLSEVNYFALANFLIDQHGTDARAEAVRLRHEALDEADALASTDWRAVEQAIALLSSDFAGTRQ